MGVLRDRMEHDLVVRGLSVHTQRVYLYVVTDLARYHRRSPAALSDRDVQRTEPVPCLECARQSLGKEKVM